MTHSEFTPDDEEENERIEFTLDGIPVEALVDDDDWAGREDDPAWLQYIMERRSPWEDTMTDVDPEDLRQEFEQLRAEGVDIDANSLNTAADLAEDDDEAIPF